MSGGLVQLSPMGSDENLIGFTPRCHCAGDPTHYVPPNGSTTPSIYFLGEAPGKEEEKTKVPFVGASGKLLRKAIVDAQMLVEEVRFGNVKGCRPFDTRGQNRTPRPDEVEACSPLVLQDIRSHRPKAIVALGETALSALYPGEKLKPGKAMEKDLPEWEGIPVYAFYHPAFLVRSGGANSKHYIDLVITIGVAGGQETAKVPDVRVFTDHEEFWNYFPEFLSRNKEVGFDIESNAYPTNSDAFEIIGVGLSSLEESIYLVVEGNQQLLDYEEGWRKFIFGHDVYIYNLSYEGSAMAAVFGWSIHDMNLLDVMQMATMRQERTTLKTLSQRKARLPDWSKQVEHLTHPKRGLYSKMINFLKPTVKYPRKEASGIKTMGLRDYLSTALTAKKVSARTVTLKKLIEELEEFHSSEEVDELFLRAIPVAEIAKDPSFEKDVYYEFLPIGIIAPYCGADAYAAVLLADNYRRTLSDREKEAFGYYNDHAKLATIMESVGVCWDDAYADDLSEFYQDKQLHHLKSLLVSPLFVKAYNSLADGKPGSTISVYKMVEILSSTDLLALKEVFNPLSNTKETKEKFVTAIHTDEFRYMRFVHRLYSAYENGHIPEDHPVHRHMAEFAKTPEERKQAFYRTLKYREVMSDICITDFSQAMDEKIETLDDAMILDMFETFKVCGVDVDDESTWNSEFWLLWHYRNFKKISKALSTYVQGKNGRQKVRILDKSDIGKPAPIRHPYRRAISPDEEIHILQTDYNYNGVETRRWSSAYHTIPHGSELRGLQTSRFEDGLISHIDYSQMEVRVLAYLAAEKAMLKAYEEGVDIHRFVASKAYKCELEEVTTDQRRYCKGGTFGILYGSTVEAFARQFMKGDLVAAKKFFADFFEAFPGVRRYIDSQHEGLKQNGYIETVFGDRIWIQYDESMGEGAKNEAMRFAQNYPIQSSASHLCALALYWFDQEMEARQMPHALCGFTHDAGDIDVPAGNLVDMLSIAKSCMEDKVKETFGVPVAIDCELGVRGDTMLEMDLEHIDDNTVIAEFEGTLPAFEEVKDRLKRAYGDSVKMEISGEAKSELVSRELIFQPKRAYSRNLGTSLDLVKGHLEIKI